MVFDETKNRTDVVLSWSGGKDSALSLWKLRQMEAPLRALLTTVTEEYDRVSMHGVRVDLLRKQAEAVCLPLIEVKIPPSCVNEEYQARMADALASPELRDCDIYAFGDLFLEDVRAYREERLATWGKKGVWPLWGRDTRVLAEEFIEAGFRGIVVCVDPSKLDGAFCGRKLDAAFLADLPSDVDPCGERGEFHTFVYDGPVFARPLGIRRGRVVERDGFIFCDLLSDRANARG
jgi:uncharacterized protein (TIGR00290 family)